MTTTAIELSNLGKCYRFGQREGATYNLPWTSRVNHWALRNINLKVSQGEVIGLLGANGSGKSTMLKVLSKITPPSEGKFSLQGRIGAVLEVSCGFHQELNGIDNIFLNGAIMGMRLWEVKKALPSVLEFSGLGDKAQWMIKRYSSGMRVRLGFSIAAHLSADVLLIDEALAVGDQAFQRQCIAKLRSLAQSGKTVVFVSHDMSVVEKLCTRGVVLRKVQLIYDGSPQEAIATYLK